MLDDLRRVVKLQHLESAAADSVRRIDEHPQRVTALEDRIARCQEALQRARDALAVSQKERRALEGEAGMAQARLSKYKDQLMEVKTNKEYQAMQKEIEVTAGEVRTIEDRILEHMISADELQAQVKRAEAEMAREQHEADAARQQLERDLVKCRQELDRLAIERDQLVRELSPSVFSIFQQVARLRKGAAVCEARDGFCTLCHVRLRPQVYNDLMRNDAIIQCESCDRILYYAAAFEAAPRS